MSEEGDVSLDAIIASLTDGGAKVQDAQRLSEVMIHLHDGKDYIDDCLPKLEALLDAESMPLLAKCYVALGIVRLLAHGWSWDPAPYHKLMRTVACALNQDNDDEAKSIAITTISEIFCAENDSDTEQEGKSNAAVLSLLERTLLPGAPTKKGKQPRVVDFLHDVLSRCLQSPASALVEAASNLLTQLPQKKRDREGDKAGATALPKGFAALLARLLELLAVAKPDAAQVGAVLKGIAKVVPEAAFEAIEDLESEDVEHFSKVQDHLVSLQEALERVLRLPGRGGGDVTFDDPKYQDEEKCPHVHWDFATGTYGMVLAIRSSPMWVDYCTKAEKGEWAAPVTAQQLKQFLLAWRGHRYHKLGSDFELVERGVQYLATKNEALWKACAEEVPLSMAWTCVQDPFAPATQGPRGFGL